MNLSKNIKIRILAFMMAFWLAFSVTYNDYQEVEALEWAIPVIGFDTAIKFLLGLLGVSLTSKALHDNVDWSEVRQNCVDYQIQQGNDAVAVGEWWEDVMHGTLNQASSCWSAFKEWVQSKINFSSGGVTGIDVAFGNVVSSCPLDIGNIRNLSSYQDRILNSSNTVCCYSINGSISNLEIISNCKSIEYVLNSDGSVSIKIGLNTSGANLTTRYYLTDNSYINSSTWSSGAYYNITISNNATIEYALFPLDSVFSSFANISYWDILGSSEGIFDSANDKIEDTSITTGDTTTTAIPDTLPLPWDNVSDTAEGVDDAISGLQEQVAEGVISLEDFWERVQELINAMAIDTTTDEVLPTTQNPDTGENETIQDKVQENVSNGSFTLAGMEKVFPFCIPWDIYAFVTLLVAEPVAPVINYPFYNPVTNQNINISIDFSDWETVVVLFRYILDFLLIIGLLLLARSLAGAGGDD